MATQKPVKKNAFYAQSGGVSAVINASAAGVIETAKKYPRRIGRREDRDGPGDEEGKADPSSGHALLPS